MQLYTVTIICCSVPVEFHPASLTWDPPPITSAKQGDVLPDFTVRSLPGVKTQVKLVPPEGTCGFT